MKSVLFSVENLNGEEDKIKVMNAVYKYSGVLNIDVDMARKMVQVDYDPHNITAEDIKGDIENEQYRVKVLNRD